MMQSTPEERGCQAPKGRPLTEEEIEKFHPYDSVKANFPNAAADPFNPKEVPVKKIIEVCNQSNETPAKKKSIEESKKLIESFKEKVATYPKYLTYEGAVVLCVMLSVNEAESINLDGMPAGDKALILSLLPSCAVVNLKRFDATLKVEFDSERDFILTYKHKDEPPVALKFFNTVIHPDKLPNTNVPVEQDGEKVVVGSGSPLVVLDHKRIQKLIGVVPPEKPKKEEDDEVLPRRQQVSGRNAYEIRADVLQMAFDWAAQGNKYTTPDDIIGVAKKFYEFVEDRKRR